MQKMLDTISLRELSMLMSDLLRLSGGGRPPLVRDQNGEGTMGFDSMGMQEFLPPDKQLDPLSSHIMWSGSFMPAQARVLRVEKGWANSITTGLAVTTDTLHQQLINFGRNSKALIDMKELDEDMRASISSIAVPFSTRSEGLTSDGVADLLAAMQYRKHIPIKLKLHEGVDRQTIQFENTHGIGPKGKSLLSVLIGLNTLSNGNVSRNTVVDHKAVFTPEKELLVVGAAQDAVNTLQQVKTELVRQLTKLKASGDKRFEGVDVDEVVSANFDLNRKALARVIKKEAGFLKVASVIADLVHPAVEPVKTIDTVLGLIDEPHVEIPIVENADQAKRLVMAAAYKTTQHYGETWQPSKQWKQIQRKYNIDTLQLGKELDSIAMHSPENPKAIMQHPETEKLMRLVELTAEKFNDAALMRMIETVEPHRQVHIEKLGETLRGPKTILGKLGLDRRRASALVDAVKAGLCKEEIGEAGERAAARYEEGKTSFSDLLREETGKPRKR